MDRWASALMLALLIGGPLSYAESPPRIEVFHTAADPIVVPSDVVVVQYVVNNAVAVENALTSRLVEASRTVDSAARRHDANNLVRQVQPEVARAVVNSYQGLRRARLLGITRVPAIIFDDGAAVVYGVRDLREALSRYRQWVANQ
jgi:integrating conjugative element protein (TIGR03757 family)